MDISAIKALVADELTATNTLILDSISSSIPLAKEIADYIFDNGGKRIRPMLLLLVAKALKYNKKDQINLAAIVELLHTATLLHDDVIDESEMRRNQPTANTKWGNEASVLVGDLLYTKAFQLIADIDHSGLTKLLANSTSIIVEGEVLQLIHRHDASTDEKTYLDIIQRKTGELFAITSAAMPVYMNLSDEETKQLRDYGSNLGTAFQMIDDTLDYIADPEKTGKNLGDDLAEGKPTLPLIYLLNNGTGEEKKLVKHAIENKGSDDLALIQKAIVESNAIQYTKEKAQHLADAACENLKVLDDSDAKKALIALAQYAVSRMQ
jgi:octaprenyl-diphosphate synthase